ncbi:MAG: AMP-binding protein [Acidimicrobiales bacterium]|nr:AMP-binding protein [Acidimicrobiales bacterium]
MAADDPGIALPDEESWSNVRQLRAQAAAKPDEPAYFHLTLDGSDQTLTWAELDRRSRQVAAAMAERGVGYGDRVGLGIRNSPELVHAVVSSWILGAVPVPIRWDVPDWELERLKEVIQPKLYLSPDDLGWIRATVNDDAPEFPDVLSPNAHGICSSGSTGTPKVVLSHGQPEFGPLSGIPIAEFFMRVTRPQRILVLAPMYHINAFATLTSMLSGDQLFVLEKFDASRIVDTIERHRITTFTATPTMMQRIADLPGIDDRDLSSIEWILQGAAPMPPSLVHRWASLIGAEKIIMAYGSSEGLGLTVVTGDQWMVREGTVGQGFREAEICILDDDGVELPAGEIGHVYIRSPDSPGTTYLGDAPDIRLTADGFGTVGDMGHVDEDGFLYLADRRVDLIITGGANVFPAEVEAALIDHPDIADVVVLGLKDAEWGRRVHAVIELADSTRRLTLDEVRAYTKDRLLAYKVPKTVEFVDALPRSEAMKLNRSRMVEERGG